MLCNSEKQEIRNKELVRNYQNAQTKREKDQYARYLIEENNPLISKVISDKFSQRPSGIPYQDIFSVGQYGIIQAADHYDFTKEVKFSTYMYTQIRAEIHKHINNEIGKSARSYYTGLMPKINKIIHQFELEGITNWDENDIYNEINKNSKRKVGMATISHVLAASNIADASSLDALYADENYQAASSNDAEDYTDDKCLKNTIEKALSELTPEEKFVICKSIGYPDSQRYKDQTIAKMMCESPLFPDCNYTALKVNHIFNRARTVLKNCPALNGYIHNNDQQQILNNSFFTVFLRPDYLTSQLETVNSIDVSLIPDYT